MIIVTVTHRQGIELPEPITIAIDPEKIVNTRDRGEYCEFEYGETFDRRREPIVYQVTTTRALINALITGTYDSKEYLELVVLNPIDATTYEFDLQEKYIVDIRPTTAIVNSVKTDCLRVEYVPGSFVPVVIYVAGAFGAGEFDFTTPAEVTTTVEITTTVEATTTAEEEQL